MAHFAKVENDGSVSIVVVVSNDILEFADGTENEIAGINFCNRVVEQGTWVQTSYNNKFRGSFASVGLFYNKDLDVFHEAQPFPSWTLGPDGFWFPPKPEPQPNPGFSFYWDEELQEWVETEMPTGE